MLLLPLRREVLRQDHVEIAPAEMPVARHRQDRQLALDEADDRYRGIHRSAVHEGHVGGLVNRHVGLVDAIRQRSCRDVVHEPQAIEAGHLGGIQHGMALSVSKVVWHRQHHVSDRTFLIELGDELHAFQHHAHRALGCQHHLLLIVADWNAHVAGANLNHLIAHKVELLLHVFRMVLLSNHCLDASDCIRQIGRDPRQRLLPQLALLAQEADHGGRQGLRDLV